MSTLHGISTYIAGGSDSSKSKSTIIYLPDAFGLKLVNNKLLADTYARRTGCRVLIPDVLRNGGIDPSIMPFMESVMEPNKHWSVGGVLYKVYCAARVIPHAVPFLVFGHPDKAHNRVLAYARAVKAELPEGGKLGVCGFCWGGMASTKLCTEASVAGGDQRLIDAQFNGHPSYISGTPEVVVDAIKAFSTPYSCAVAEHDFQFSQAVAEKTEAKLREELGADEAGKYVYEFKVYKGCHHGFCVRAKEDTDNMTGYKQAIEQAVSWFNKYLN
jgi:dienelactone hydrolase